MTLLSSLSDADTPKGIMRDNARSRQELLALTRTNR